MQADFGIEWLAMPVLPHAKKKQRVDERRRKVNQKVRTKAKRAIAAFRSEPSEELLGKAFSAIDRAAKKNVFHKGKADRLKARLSKVLAKA